jgi:hypothetical protein
VVAEDQNGETVAWASLNQFFHGCADNGIADLSVYVARPRSGIGIGNALLRGEGGFTRASVFGKSGSFASMANSTGDSLTS